MLSALATDRARVADLEAQIVELERSLAALVLEKTIAQERLNAYTYPVLTLPDEIISEIFIHFIPIYPACPPITGLLSPTLLTHICRKWRTIARTTPALWRAISLSSDGTPFQNPAYISDILSRSGCLPLSIELNYHDSEDDDSESKVLQAAFLHCKRWEYVELCSWGFDLPIIERDLPLLRHISLDFDDGESQIPYIIINDAPLLRKAVLGAVNLSKLMLPWEQLTSLTVDQINADAWIPVLQQTSNLVHCELSLYDTGIDNNNPPPEVILPCLQSLTYDNLDVGFDNLDPGDDDGYDGFLNVVFAPALRSLRIAEIFLRPNPIGSLASFIAKSGCNLEELAVAGKRWVPASSYRKAFPSIGKFSFDGGADEDYATVEGDSDSRVHLS
ncbi:hypothetical protein MVEN_02271900 [Mycena venus]|uniref:F-box domain-containing protein n=1 Tax=Mycena venus TaxID=2733690 RepID=A0A8H6X5K4_9AGAR|nr:hypothetical protein MVEN_02271900 [Mycena venus]